MPQRGGGYDSVFPFLVAAGVLGAVLTTIILRSRRAREATGPELAPVA